jgi:hypothetical protein
VKCILFFITEIFWGCTKRDKNIDKQDMSVKNNIILQTVVNLYKDSLNNMNVILFPSANRITNFSIGKKTMHGSL